MAEAGSSPTRTTVRPVWIPFSCLSWATFWATSARTWAAICFPSMIMGRGV